MATLVLLPKLGVTMEEGKIVSWCKQEGEPVSPGDILFEIETDKVTMEVEAKEAGVLRKILVPEGETVPVTTPVAIIGTIDEDISHLLNGTIQQTETQERPGLTRTREEEMQEESEESEKEAFILATPRAKKLAREKGIDLRKIKGSGENGRILEEDVIKYLESQDKATAIPLDGVRRIIAARLSQSAHESPHVYFTREIDMTACLKLKNELSYKVTLTDFFVLAVARVLRQYPVLNASLAGDQIILNDEVNIGIAVDAEKGLIVPVLKGADKKSLAEIATERAKLVEAAREGKLFPDQVEGGTFTISNLGMYGVDHFTAIINPPESAILSVGTCKRRVVASEEGDIRVRPITQVTLAVDHRIIDGALAARFLEALTTFLEKDIHSLFTS